MKRVNLPLFDDPYYKYTATLQKKTYTLEFQYNRRADAWFFSLRDVDGTYLFTSVRLVPYHRIGQDFKITGLTGCFALTSNSRIEPEALEGKMRDIRSFFSFAYFYEE